MKRVTGIGFSIPSNDDNDYIRLDSLSSLSDTDIAIFAPDFSSTYYSTYESHGQDSYQGKRLYNRESSAKILEHSAHWRKELFHFVENGGTLVIVLTPIKDFYIYSGTNSVSGSGKNQTTTNHVGLFDNYKLLPFSEIEFNTISGKNVFANSPVIYDLQSKFKEYFTYETYISGKQIDHATFTTKNKDRALGINLKLKKGYVYFIPNLNLETDKFLEYDKKTGENTWNAEGIKKGKSLVNCIIELDNAIRKDDVATPKPQWLTEKAYRLEASQEILGKIKANLNIIKEKKDENLILHDAFEDHESLKDLLFETGKPLELAVTKSLVILGYKAENYENDVLELDQIIISPEGHRLIGECEGKDNKDIDISKFRQLQDALNEDFEREDVEEKAYGLLIGNPQRLLNPTERTLTFTKKCQDGAKREKIGLIKTEDLFIACRYILESKDEGYALKCRAAIMEQLGEIIMFPAIKYTDRSNED